jgi:drug/metabolite transporter (DMT)-like permease
MLIFTVVAKYFVFNDVITKYMWTGVAINTVAMVLVGSTALFMPADIGNKSGREPIWGVLFILCSCATNAMQYVVEEKFLQIKVNGNTPPPLLVVGMEGFYGSIMMVGVLYGALKLPGEDPSCDCFENVFDSWTMYQNSELARWMLWGFIISVGLYNIFCIFVTKFLRSADIALFFFLLFFFFFLVFFFFRPPPPVLSPHSPPNLQRHLAFNPRQLPSRLCMGERSPSVHRHSRPLWRGLVLGVVV